MSFVVPTNLPPASKGRDQPFFWIRLVDDNGFEVDKRFAEAAYQKVRQLRLYRAQELVDEAVRADLVEKAVYAASRARKSEEVRDAKSYVFAAFARLVDQHIAKEGALDHKLSSELDHIHLARHGSSVPRSIDVDEAIFLEQVLNAMSPEDRWVWKRRLVGYEVQEIAAQLDITPDCLSTRIRRSIHEVSRVLRLRRARQ